MLPEQHGQQIARLDERDRDILRRLESIEGKVDRLQTRVASVAGTIALGISLVVTVVVTNMA